MSENQPHPATPPPAAPAPATGAGNRILVVDDEPAQQTLSRKQLQKLGYETTVAASGEEAVSLFTAAQKANQPAPFALILMDLVMQGLDGMASSKAILALYPGQRIVIVSGYTRAQTAEASQLGLAWLAKPYTIAELAQTVRAILTSDS